MSCFDLGDVEGVRASLELVPGASLSEAMVVVVVVVVHTCMTMVFTCPQSHVLL